MKRTPLYERHVAAGAKLVDFAGWEMPIQYSGVIDEYQTVRTAAGLFDVSHMGRFTVEGRDVLTFLQHVTTNNVGPLAVGAAQYSMVCNQTGGIKDDIFIYRLAATRFLLCVNASNREKIFSWFCAKAPQGDVRLSDESDELAQIALQGPRSPQVLRAICPAAADSLKPRHCLETDVLRTHGIVSRTGYTGEVGYELYLPSSSAKPVWDALMKAGAPVGIKPCGLGSRDLLRLEVGYLLYGNDIDEQTTPLEASAAFAVDFTKGEFIGSQALHEQRAKGPAKRLVGFELIEKGVPRHGMKILADGQDIGLVSSGNLSPRLQKGIGLGYVPAKLSEPGTPIQIDIRGRVHPAVVVKLPFYQRTKA
ncbi:MAG: glycine cleavage system aminomethyltransferase GcvT [Nitrospirota bacterium]|nr:glycine cleavage system aminomethyltransferase GcvT [Nitrospirota bacterium]